MGDITSANAVYAITIPLLFPIPQQLQGFATDDIYNTADTIVAQTQMGVDGVMSAGFTPTITEQSIFLSADSASRIIFDTWNQTQKTTRSIIPAAALVTLKSIGRKYTHVFGVLQTYKPLPDAKKILQSVRYVIHWQSIDPVPM